MLWLVVALLSPVDVRAERLETDGARWQADDVELRRRDLTVRAKAARGGPSAGCLADIRLDGPVALDAHGGRLTAGSASLCVRDETTRISAEDLRATACRCDAPPWTVTATSGHAVAGEGAWVMWPVLWAGPVPVAAAPAWYVPFSRRRTGFLLPQLGWHGTDGPWARLPFFWALGQSVDLTLEGGYRHGHGADGRGRLRWAASERDRGVLEAGLVDRDWLVEGRGTAPVGPLRLALDGAVTGAPAAWRTTHPRFDQQRDHLRGTVGASVAGPLLGAGVRAVALQDLRQDAAPFTFADGNQVFPEVWLAWTAPAGPASVMVDAQALELVAFDAADTQLFDLAVAGDATLWLGPLRMRPAGGLATTVHTAEGRSGQRLAGWLGGELEVALGRRFVGGTSHTVHLVLDGRYAGTETVEAPPSRQVAADRAPSSRAVGATLSNRMRGPDWSSRLDLRVGHEAEAPVEGRESLWATAVVERRVVGVEAATYGTEVGWGRLRLGPGDGARVVGGLGHVGRTRRGGWYRTLGAQRPLQWAFDERARATTAEARGVVPLGRLRLGYGAYVDPDGGALLGQDAHVAYDGACDCWSMRLEGSHLRGRDAPDIWLSVTLGAGP